MSAYVWLFLIISYDFRLFPPMSVDFCLFPFICDNVFFIFLICDYFIWFPDMSCNFRWFSHLFVVHAIFGHCEKPRVVSKNYWLLWFWHPKRRLGWNLGKSWQASRRIQKSKKRKVKNRSRSQHVSEDSTWLFLSCLRT